MHQSCINMFKLFIIIIMKNYITLISQGCLYIPGWMFISRKERIQYGSYLIPLVNVRHFLAVMK